MKLAFQCNHALAYFVCVCFVDMGEKKLEDQQSAAYTV